MAYIGQTITTVFPTSVSLDTVTATTSLKTPLVEFTDGDDALSIADGGAVTFQSTVSGLPSGADAFSARANADAWASISAGTIVEFPDDSSGDNFDTGSRYSTSTYKYTARATGVYLFWYSIYVANADASNGYGFLKNSSRVAMQYNATYYFTFDETNDDKVQNGTVILPLSTDDTMAVIAVTDSDYYRGHSMWGGCRLA